MSELARQRPDPLLQRADTVVLRAMRVRAALEDEPIERQDFHGVGSCTLSGPKSETLEDGDEPLLIGFEGKPTELAFQPCRWIISILAGDCVDLDSGEMVAYYARTELSSGRTARIALPMSFEDAGKIVSACSAVAELPAMHLRLAIKRRFEADTAASLKNKFSPDGYPPVAPHWAKIL